MLVEVMTYRVAHALASDSLRARVELRITCRLNYLILPPQLTDFDIPMMNLFIRSSPKHSSPSTVTIKVSLSWVAHDRQGDVESAALILACTLSPDSPTMRRHQRVADG